MIVVAVVAVVHVNDERVVRIVRLARPVVVVGPASGTVRYCASSCGDSHSLLLVGRAFRPPPIFGLSTWTPLYRPACFLLSRWVKAEQHQGEGSAGDTV